MQVCTHKGPYNLFCHDGCWEAQGLSSRFIEAVMKGMHVRLLIDPVTNECSNYPRDADDFSRCYKILQKHPEWLPFMHRLNPFGVVWKRLVARWDELTTLYEGGNFEELTCIIRGLSPSKNILPIKHVTSYPFIQYYGVGSLVPHTIVQTSEYDMIPCIVVNLPFRAGFDHLGSDPHDLRYIENTDVFTAICDTVQETVKANPRTWQSVSYHHCPCYGEPQGKNLYYVETPTAGETESVFQCCLLRLDEPISILDGQSVTCINVIINKYYEDGLVNAT